MSRRRRGLCLMLVLTLVGLSAAAAQAAPKFKILNKDIAGTVGIESESDQDFMLLIPAKNLEVLCEQFAIEDGLLFVGGKGLAKPSFTQCVVRMISPLDTLKSCTVTVTSSPVVGSLILLGKTTYALIEPDEVSVFATLNFSGAGCVLPAHVNITGALVLEDCGGEAKDLAVELVRHLVEQAPEELFPEYTLHYGASTARLDGSVRGKLTAPNVNEFWSGIGS
jgi:hypothetical protein